MTRVQALKKAKKTINEKKKNASHKAKAKAQNKPQKERNETTLAPPVAKQHVMKTYSKVTSSGDNMTVSGLDFLAAVEYTDALAAAGIAGTVPGAGSVLLSRVFNPNNILESRMSILANTAIEYRVKALNYYWESSTGTAATGDITMEFDPFITEANANHNALQNTSNAVRYSTVQKYSSTFPIWSSSKIGPIRQLKGEANLFIETLANEPTQAFFGEFFLMAAGSLSGISAGTPLGKVFVEYEIEYLRPGRAIIDQVTGATPGVEFNYAGAVTIASGTATRVTPPAAATNAGIDEGNYGVVDVKKCSGDLGSSDTAWVSKYWAVIEEGGNLALEFYDTIQAMVDGDSWVSTATGASKLVGNFVTLGNLLTFAAAILVPAVDKHGNVYYIKKREKQRRFQHLRSPKALQKDADEAMVLKLEQMGFKSPVPKKTRAEIFEEEGRKVGLKLVNGEWEKIVPDVVVTPPEKKVGDWVPPVNQLHYKGKLGGQDIDIIEKDEEYVPPPGPDDGFSEPEDLSKSEADLVKRLLAAKAKKH